MPARTLPGRQLSLRPALVLAPVLLAALLGAAPAYALPDAQFQPAFSLFMRANAGDESAIEPAAEALTELLQREPGNPVLMAYAGSATSMKAITTWLPWRKMAYAEDGLAMLDKALALLRPEHDAPIQNGNPGSLEVKFVAASTFLAVPGFMNRHERGNRLLAEAVASPLMAKATPSLRASIWMMAGREELRAKRPDEARRYWKLAAESGAPQAQRARALLEKLP